MAYRFLQVHGDHVEVCDECGFHGGTLDPGATVAGLRSLGPRWTSALRHPQELLRARPDPDTYCAVEYCLHTAFTLRAITWAAEQYAAGRAPAWEQLDTDALPGAYEYPEHACDDVGPATALAELSAAAEAAADLAGSLTPEQRAFVADYHPGMPLSTFAVIRHALHDADHHLLDVHRGIARLTLAAVDADAG